MPFKPEVKTKLLEALRSGKYKKDTEVSCVLRSASDCYCVMGVAADIVAPEKWGRRLHSFSAYLFDGVFVSAVGHEVLEALGISQREEWDLNSLNDDKKAKRSFAELADIIERNY